MLDFQIIRRRLFFAELALQLTHDVYEFGGMPRRLFNHQLKIMTIKLITNINKQNIDK
jgi:hypothetical protein